MTELYTYRIVKLNAGELPIDYHNYWNVGPDFVYTVPADADWYKFEIFFPESQGGGLWLFMDTSPADDGFIAMNSYWADYYGKFITDLMNGVPASSDMQSSGGNAAI